MNHVPKILLGGWYRISLLGAVLTLPIGSAAADIVPDSRLAPWQDNVGVPGGIPVRTKIGATVDSVKFGNGTTDATAAISAAINACGPNQVAYLPAGTYRVNSRVLIQAQNNFSLRGAGQGQTTIKAYSDGSEVLHLGSADYPYPTNGVSVTGGATRGSSVLTLSSTSQFTVGNLCHITQSNLPYVVGNNQKVVFKVAAKTPNTVTLNHALPCDFTNSPVLVPYVTPPLSGVGVESLTIDCNNLASSGIYMEQVWGCWIKDVEIKKSTNRQMFLIIFNQSEIRHCYTHDTYTKSGPDHEGIDIYNNGSWNLIEDNICENGGFPQIVLGDGAGGDACNVIAYNFCKNAVTGTDIGGADISFNHGPHNSFNLAEGNIIGNGISSDGYSGSSSHNTMLRNWAAAKPYKAGLPTAIQITNGLRAIQLNRMSNYCNVVGNVLGDSSFSKASNVGNYETTASGYPETQLIYQLGFPNLGNNGYTGTRAATSPPSYSPAESVPSGYQQYDSNVKNTLIRHGNYDYYNGAQLWDPSISDHTIPQSYYLTSKPTWFGDLTWPPINPASPPGAFNDGNISKIPAGYRFINGKEAPGVTNPLPPPAAPTGLHVVSP